MPQRLDEMSDPNRYQRDQSPQPDTYRSPYAGRAGYDRIASAYQQHLGRAGSDDEILSHLDRGRWLDGGGNVNQSVGSIANSQEAIDRRARSSGAPPPTGSTTPPPTSDASGRSGMPTGTERPWGGSNLPYEGFDFNRAQNVEKSAKDAFAAFATEAGAPPPGANKAALTDWFNQNIAPKMNALGHQINWVEGDKMNFTNWQGTFTVDWVRGAGADGWALAWQVEDGGAGGAKTYQPSQNTTQPAGGPVKLPEPIQNEDGTVSIQVNPAAYELLAPQLEALQFSRGRSLADFGPRQEVV